MGVSNGFPIFVVANWSKSARKGQTEGTSKRKEVHKTRVKSLLGKNTNPEKKIL
jgi:hypothetical protein